MVIIGFSNKTSLPIVRVLCRQFKHCVIITQNKNKFVLHQFIKRNHVRLINIKKNGIAQLMLNGWVFIYINPKHIQFNPHAWTCVNYVKHAIGIKNIWVQTPNALYKYLKKI